MVPHRVSLEERLLVREWGASRAKKRLQGCAQGVSPETGSRCETSLQVSLASSWFMLSALMAALEGVPLISPPWTWVPMEVVSTAVSLTGLLVFCTAAVMIGLVSSGRLNGRSRGCATSSVP